MQFRIYVDPPSAMRAGNSRIGEQVVTVELLELSQEERDVVADSYVTPSSPRCVDLTKSSAGDRIEDVLDVKLASADRNAILELIHARIDAKKERERLKAFAETHFEAAIGPVIAEYFPAFRAFTEKPREDELVEQWMSKHFPEDLRLSQEEEGVSGPLSNSQPTLVKRISSSIRVTIGHRNRFDSHRTDGYLRISTKGLPDDEAGIDYLSKVALRMMDDPDREQWVRTQWENRRAVLEEAFKAELNKKRNAIEAMVEEERRKRQAAKDDADTIVRIVQAADVAAPGQHIKERFRAGVLPEVELLALLRDVAFRALDGTTRFKRISDSDVKRRKNQEVTYKVIDNTQVKAKYFELAKELEAKLPEAKVSQVTHRAIVEGFTVLERDAVRVTVKFAGHVLSREYIPG